MEGMQAKARPAVWLGLGLALGAGYSVVDYAFDTSLTAGGPLHAFETFHRLFNAVIPPIAGMVAGLLFAYLRQRDALIESQRRFSEALTRRLRGVERHQAVWLLASSLLHDIRNPLHALGLLLDEAVGVASRNGKDDVAELLTKALAQADRMEERIASLRDLAESPPRERLHVDFADVIRRISQELTDVARKQQVSLVLAEIPSIALDVDLPCLRTALENLVANAIEATTGREDDASRQVTLSHTRMNDRDVLLVRDNGCGVDSNEHERVFEPLRSGKRRGLGLGLPLARALARLEGGDVRLVESRPGCTVFALELPTGRRS